MRKILVGIDGSARESGVLDAAVAIAEKMGGQLTLLQSVSIPIDVPHEAFAMTPADVGRLIERATKERLDKLLATLPAAVRGETRVRMGTAWDAICRVAEEEAVDLVVIGSHGYGVIDRVLGTTAAKVVNHADRSVLIVRSPEKIVAPRATPS